MANNITRIQLRRGDAAEWTSFNPVLASGEPGVEVDTGRYKLGDGVTAWNLLPYASPSDADINAVVAPALAAKANLQNGKLLETEIPERLTEGQLSATYATKDEALTVPEAETAIGDDLDAMDANPVRLGLLRSVRPATGYDGVPLQRFRDALEQRKTRPVTVSHIGDSITVGTGGGFDGRFASILRDTLRTMYPTSGDTTGGRGFLSANPNNYGPVTYGGGASYTQGGTYGYSPDQSYTRLDNPGYTATWEINGTGADILYTQISPGGGMFYWSVDGGPQTVVDTNIVYDGTTSVAQIRGLTSGPHSVEVGHSAAGVSAISGLVEYDGDEASGFRQIVGGVGGTTTVFWTGNSGRHFDYMPTYQPDLVVIGLGTNDYYHSTARISSVAYKTNLLSIIQSIKDHTAVDPSIVLLLPAPLPATAPLDPFIDYKTAAHAIAAADHTNVSVFDWGMILNPTDTATTADGLIGSDLVHPTVAGHELIGQSIARHVGVV